MHTPRFKEQSILTARHYHVQCLRILTPVLRGQWITIVFLITQSTQVPHVPVKPFLGKLHKLLVNAIIWFGFCLVNPKFPRLSNPLGCSWHTLKIETNNNHIETQVET